MPADKYSYKPTAAQWTFGKIIAHMAGDNRITCSAIAGVAPEKSPEPSATASKAELVKYATSGDVSMDFDHVVGYAGMVVS